MIDPPEAICRRRLQHSGLSGKVSAFTVTELLVVIVVIALLLIVAHPVVSRVVEVSRTARCVNNLKQLGAVLILYQTDRVHLIPGDDAAFGNPENFTWLSALRNYCDLSKLRSCPSAPVPGGASLRNSDGNQWGSVNTAWGLSPGSWLRPTNDPGYASYGLNMWTRKGFHDHAIDIYRGSFGNTRVENTQNIPMIMDARWEGLWPLNEDPLPPVGSLRHQKELPVTGANWRMADNLAMLRHGIGVNICFMDGSVRNVDVNDLWTLQWNKLYQPQPRQNLR